MAGQLLVEDRAPLLRVLTLSNPGRRGAADDALLLRLVEEARRASGDGTRCLVLTGAAGDFCSGYDLGALEAADTGAAAAFPDARVAEACAALEVAGPPVIAAIAGPAYGAGAELGCACDLRIGGEAARFCLPPAKLGLVYSAEGVARVARLTGPSQAARLFFTAAVVDAQEAKALGLLDAIAADPLAQALAEAARIVDQAPLAVAGMKRILRLLARPSLDAAASAEVDSMRRRAFQSDDAREGRAAFRERRPPRFRGR